MGREMMVFVVLVEDRYTDTAVEVWLTAGLAIGRAQFIATQRANETPESEPLNATMVANGWIYHTTYSIEGDSVTVLRREVKD